MTAKKIDQSRHWCYTLNNYTDDEVAIITNVNARYNIFGREVGENGTPHLQGYIEFDKPTRMVAVKKLLSLRVHLETRQGTRDEARDYCMKDNNFTETGKWSAGGAGARNDLHGLMELIRDDVPTIEVMETVPATYARHQRFAEKYTTLVEKDNTRDFRTVNVTVLWGGAGTGKTSKVMELTDRKVFLVNPADSFPFDGYDGEPAILLDDFYGGIQYGYLLRILDGHQLRVNVKGGHRYARWTNVYITSNVHPRDWYKVGLTPALERRLSTIEQLSPLVPLVNPNLMPAEPVLESINEAPKIWYGVPWYEVPGNTGPAPLENNINNYNKLIDECVEDGEIIHV